MSRIARMRARNIRYSTEPRVLADNLVTNTSLFDDFATKKGGWLGDVFSTLVEIETDDGAVGVGTAGAFSGAARGIIETYLPELVLGADVTRHDWLWQRAYRTLIRFGRSGAAVSALSALDIACWDAHGRIVNRPVHELLGGATQVNVPVYASRLYATEDHDALRAEAREYLDAGFARMKQRFGWGPVDGEAGMSKNVALVAAVRDEVGPDVQLAADAYMGWDFGYALQMADRLREFRLSWIEEPLMPQETDRYAELLRRVPWQRWSHGEHSYTKWDFARLLNEPAADIVQPDLNRAGGITEGRKICALAEAAGRPVIPHSNEAHNLHLIFSQPANVCPVVEYFPNAEPDTGNELFWRLFAGNAEQRGGFLSLPDGPGLGVTVVDDLAEQLATDDGTWIS